MFWPPSYCLVQQDVSEPRKVASYENNWRSESIGGRKTRHGWVEAGSRVDWKKRRFMVKRHTVFPKRKVAVLKPIWILPVSCWNANAPSGITVQIFPKLKDPPEKGQKMSWHNLTLFECQRPWTLSRYARWEETELRVPTANFLAYS